MIQAEFQFDGNSGGNSGASTPFASASQCSARKFNGSKSVALNNKEILKKGMIDLDMPIEAGTDV